MGELGERGRGEGDLDFRGLGIGEGFWRDCKAC